MEELAATCYSLKVDNGFIAESDTNVECAEHTWPKDRTLDGKCSLGRRCVAWKLLNNERTDVWSFLNGTE